MKPSEIFEEETVFGKTIQNLKKTNKKELRAIIKWAEKEIDEYDKLVNYIKKELRSREK